MPQSWDICPKANRYLGRKEGRKEVMKEQSQNIEHASQLKIRPLYFLRLFKLKKEGGILL